MAGIKELIQNTLDGWVLTIKDNIHKENAWVTGKTGNSLEVVQIDDTHWQILGCNYFQTLEKGREGGKVPKGFYYIIKQWAKDKGIVADNINRFAYFTARKIADYGTELYRKGGRTSIYTDVAETGVEELQDKLLEIIEIQIDGIKRD